MSTVTVGTLTMHGANQHSDGVYQVGAEFFEHWYSIAPSKTDVRQRPVADGAFGIDRDWRTSLALPLSGRFRGPEWRAMLEDLTAVLGTGGMVPVTVDDGGTPTSRMVSVRSFVPRPMPGAEMCTFIADFEALDPRRYGTELAPFTGLPTAGTGFVWPGVWPADWGSGGNPGRVEAVNSGRATTYPMLEVQGGLSGGVELVEITTGSYLRLERPIPAGSTVFFDTRTGSVYLDAAANDVTDALTRRDWAGFAIPAQSTRTVQFNSLGVASGTPRLTVRFSPAY